VGVELRQQAADVGPSGGGGDVQALADLGTGPAVGHLGQHLELPGGQRSEQLGGRRSSARGGRRTRGSGAGSGSARAGRPRRGRVAGGSQIIARVLMSASSAAVDWNPLISSGCKTRPVEVAVEPVVDGERGSGFVGGRAAQSGQVADPQPARTE
jgi:hypothetical protein